MAIRQLMECYADASARSDEAQWLDCWTASPRRLSNRFGDCGDHERGRVGHYGCYDRSIPEQVGRADNQRCEYLPKH